MHEYRLTLTLLSDATFGRGEGIAGLIDREVEHDRYGLPYLRGRTLKGLITEEADNILYALDLAGADLDRWVAARRSLFGQPGSKSADRGRLRFGPAELPAVVREAVRNTPGGGTDAFRRLVLESLTAIRRQTAIETDGERAGVPADGSLRAMRVILRQTPFVAQLLSDDGLSPEELALLAASVLAFRRAGTGRNRGRGKLVADLETQDGDSLLPESYNYFRKEALGQTVAKEPAS